MNFSHKTNKLRPRKRLCQLLLLSVLLLFTALPAVSSLNGKPCSDCHTMHYSQSGGALSSWGDSGPYNALLIDTCVGCHTGTNSAGSTPYVMSTTEPTYGTDTLAGGSFFWVASGNQDKGHNVVGIATGDSQPIPPGFDAGIAAADGSVPGANWSSNQITCAGTYGCHGTHDEIVAESAIAGGHHSNSSGAIESPGTSPGGGYRMLVGVAGYEDADWEYTKSQSDHNQYKGVDGGSYSDATVSSLCRRCHNNFHSDISGSSPWLRHPIDFDMGSTAAGSEVRGYGPAYNTEVPVASTDVSSRVSTVSFVDDTIVTCLSCHRAHGSYYDKLLRWDYFNSAYVSDTAGCAVCHTSKK